MKACGGELKTILIGLYALATPFQVQLKNSAHLTSLFCPLGLGITDQKSIY